MLTQGGFRKATEYYEKALAIDTYYALPYVGLAEVMGFRTYWGNYKPSENMPVVEQHIEKALKKDSNIA